MPDPVVLGAWLISVVIVGIMVFGALRWLFSNDDEAPYF